MFNGDTATVVSHTLPPRHFKFVFRLLSAQNKLTPRKPLWLWRLLYKTDECFRSNALCFLSLLSASGEEARCVSGPTPPNVAQTRASAHPEGAPSQSDTLHRRQVWRSSTSIHIVPSDELVLLDIVGYPCIVRSWYSCSALFLKYVLCY